MLVSKFEIPEIKTTAKGPHQENREILTHREIKAFYSIQTHNSCSKILYRMKIHFRSLSRLQLASANRVAALTSRDGILWVQGIPNVKNRLP